MIKEDVKIQINFTESALFRLESDIKIFQERGHEALKGERCILFIT